MSVRSLRFLLFPTLFIFLGAQQPVRHPLYPPPAPTGQAGLDVALEATRHTFHEDLDSLLRASAAYRDAVAQRAPAERVREKHLATRRQFKYCEYLLEYLEPESVRRYLNGAPLPKTEPNVPEVVIVAPTGLQVLDELAYADDLDYAALGKHTQTLYTTLHRLVPYVRSIPLQHRHVFEASREEAIRIFTLGVTGFDTPGSVAALPEAEAALRRLADVYLRYAPYVAREEPATDQAIREALRVGLAQLPEADFATFDRMAFLRSTVDPLIAKLPRAQELLSVESAADDPRQARPVNARALSLFAEDFLNPAYYDRLSASPYGAERRRLGELLFFDPVLSGDRQLSCASCHQPELAFTDGKAKSVRRNAPTLINSVFAERYFYDLREAFLERQARHVVMDAHEFATDFVAIEERLRQQVAYRELFAEAYADQPDYALSAWSISDALTHYVSGLRAFDSPVDRYVRGELSALEPGVRRGFNLFMGKAACGSCHFPPTFAGLVPPLYRESETEVLGVPHTPVWEGARVDPDPGRYASGRPEDEADFRAFSFKTPTVRNVSVTAPYMHNGVYTSLAEVLDFYNRGGGRGIGIELEHQTLPFDNLSLDKAEVADLIDFMEALTDYQALNRRPERPLRRSTE